MNRNVRKLRAYERDERCAVHAGHLQVGLRSRNGYIIQCLAPLERLRN
jgi:hypothetical protein